ncbi:MAG: DUF4440 domain-containing protein [Gemmatimonadales bacterium]
MTTLLILIPMIASAQHPLPACPAFAMRATGSRADADTVVAISQRLLDAIALGDTATWSRYLSADAIFADEEATIRDRATMLQQLSPLPPGVSGHICIVAPHAVVHGDVAVVTYDGMEDERVFGQLLQTHYHVTDTYVREDGAWRVLGSHTAVLPSEHKAVSASPRLLNDYLGRYALTPGTAYTLTRNGDRLFGQRGHHAPEEFLPLGIDHFFRVGAVRGELVFHRDAHRRVDALIDRRDNNDLLWRRLPRTPH